MLDVAETRQRSMTLLEIVTTCKAREFTDSINVEYQYYLLYCIFW
jgi:hypothetical protein